MEFIFLVRETDNKQEKWVKCRVRWIIFQGEGVSGGLEFQMERADRAPPVR